ncbi:hypothetical protein [Methyloglobulus sp.]|uniref:hypothetical protein n=1 Tax=Methyloglobulus sp. TaxID=2518622 RepID=UPI0032B743E7
MDESNPRQQRGTRAQCYPNATNIHPETYSKFQKQLAKVVPLWEMINWCLRNPLEGQPLAADDPKMIALKPMLPMNAEALS